MTERVIPELLAPAGDLERLAIAYQFGADACYIGATQLSLRKRAVNHNADELDRAIAIARQAGKKLYVAVNALPLERDAATLPQVLDKLAELGPDGVIVADPGVAREVVARGLPLHVSTQASVCNADSIRWWQDLGAKRVVLAREVDLISSGALGRETGTQIEVFIHGAQCASFSGRCAISNYHAGRDANRGGCEQSCRNPFVLLDENGNETEHAALMNARDLQGLDLVPLAAQAGIHALKVEGRMKTALYVATTCAAYRAVLDALAAEVTDAELQATIATWSRELSMLRHRGQGTGGLVERPFTASINHDARSQPQQQAFAGIVMSQDAERGALVHTRSVIHCGDKISWLEPGAVSGGHDLTTITDRRGNNLDRAPAERLVWLPMSAPVGSIVRVAA